MNLLIFLSFLFLIIYKVSSNADEENFKQIDSIYPEEDCTSNGGMCVIAKDCTNIAQKGLCPQQQHQGVECCYGVSEKETRCHKRGGYCSDANCKTSVYLNKPTDCPENTSCCLLVEK